VEKARAKTEAKEKPQRRRIATIGLLFLLFLVFLTSFEFTRASTPLVVAGAGV
jgi:hypothetical protein